MKDYTCSDDAQKGSKPVDSLVLGKVWDRFVICNQSPRAEIKTSDGNQFYDTDSMFFFQGP